MATSINRSNLIALADSSSYLREHEFGRNGTCIVFAGGVMVQAHCKSAIFKKSSCSIDIYYRSGNSWVKYRNVEKSKSGSGSANSNWYGINCPTANETVWHPTCIFKIVYSGSYSGSAYWRARIKTLNTAQVCSRNSSFYDNYMKSRFIRYCDNEVWQLGDTYATEAAVLNARTPDKFRGNPITSALAANCAIDNLNY